MRDPLQMFKSGLRFNQAFQQSDHPPSMGLLKKSTSSRRLGRTKSIGRFPSRLLSRRASPAPPQIITSTPVASTREPHKTSISSSQDGITPSPHLAVNISSSSDHLDRPIAQQSCHLNPETPPDRHLTSPQNLQHGRYPHPEDAHLLGVLPSLHPDDRFPRTRKAVSHSDLHSQSHVSGGLSHGGLYPGSRSSRPTSPGPSIHSGVPPSSFKDLTVLYQVVAERRTAFDNLLWQVPATSLTAHAFLFSISLAADTGRFARIASMSLCVVITVLTLHLFTRQLQAEDADHRWLADFEERHQIEYPDRAHGDRWKEYRAQKPRGAGRLGWLAMHRSYPLWSKGMLIIGFLAIAILILAIFDPEALLGYNCDPR